MYDIRITKINIEKVRHLKDIEIPATASDGERKHLIITGKNGSGKTSLLDAISKHLDWLATQGDPKEQRRRYEEQQKYVDALMKGNTLENEIQRAKEQLHSYEKTWHDAQQGVNLSLSVPLNGIMGHFRDGDFVLAYYKDNRIFESEKPRHVEKVELKENYSINPQPKATPRYEFIKYLLDMKVTEALAARSEEKERQKRAEVIRAWFKNFEALLQEIFNDCGDEKEERDKKSVQLLFDEKTYAFTIQEDGKEPFDFNNLSAGFAAVLDIVVDLIMRMEKHTGGSFRFDLPGIVLIDEIETHLHLELQRAILPFLTTFFPNVQFIVSTHSPFILNSIEHVVVYDLENKTLVNEKQGLTDIPYDGIIEGYFRADKLSAKLREKYERFKELVAKKDVTDEDMREISQLEIFLDEIPDYLAWGIATEYKRLKSEFEAREDL